MAEAAELEAWVRQELSLGEDGSVSIGEKPGTDPRCSPVITEVTVTPPGQDSYSFHIEQALADVTEMDFIAALAFGGGH